MSKKGYKYYWTGYYNDRDIKLVNKLFLVQNKSKQITSEKMLLVKWYSTSQMSLNLVWI